MISKRLIFLCLLFWASATLSQEGAAPKTLCFFSLNNSKEFELTRSFLNEAKAAGYARIQTLEFHDPNQDANPESSFRKMVESRQTCDGLVISGHHTGSFSGARAKGVLNIGFLEQLSCAPSYRDFFQQVQALWLQGCRTLGNGPMALEGEPGNELQADYHMQRVGAELIQTGLEQSFADLSFEFSTTLDQDNPLASRYLRVFPAANVFGWTKTSPGIKAKSEVSLLYHMAHMAHISQGVPLFNPLRVNSSARKTHMSNSLQKVLEGNSTFSSVAGEAWLSHGRVKTSGLGFDNPDLNTYPPLLYSSQENLLAAKSLGCKVRNSVNYADVERALVSILSNQDYLAYNLNVVWEIFQQYAQEDPVEYGALRDLLASSNSLMSLLNRKLKSPQTGLVMKIEYYSLYKELTGRHVPEVESLILQQVRYFLLAQDLAGSGYDIRDFREALLLSLARHQLADTSYYLDVIHAPETQSATLYALSWSFLTQSPDQAELLVNEIVKHPRVENDSLRVAAIWMMNQGTNEGFDILQTIVAHPQVDEATLGAVATVLVKYDLKTSAQLAQNIVTHPASDSFVLSQVTLAIRKHHIEVDNTLLEEILAHPALDKWGLQNVAQIVGDNWQPGSAGLLVEVVDHQHVDAIALTSVVIAMKNHGFEGDSDLLQSIRKHPQANARTLQYVDRTIARNAPPVQAKEFL